MPISIDNNVRKALVVALMFFSIGISLLIYSYITYTMQTLNYQAFQERILQNPAFLGGPIIPTPAFWTIISVLGVILSAIGIILLMLYRKRQDLQKHNHV